MEKVKEKNSVLNILFVGLIAVLYGLFIGAIVYALSSFFSIFIFFGSYLIGRFMLKYLSYYTTFHKILAGIYALLCYLSYMGILIFLFLINDFHLEPSAIFSLPIGFIWEIFLNNMGIFDWLILILMPISAYMYLEYRGKL
jgi:hypothetical protein